ncbi:GRAM domain-containing protein [Blakeslea trispora]|nr:GRAM domain-containing protein [Blakeslea trispora]
MSQNHSSSSLHRSIDSISSTKRRFSARHMFSKAKETGKSFTNSRKRHSLDKIHSRPSSVETDEGEDGILSSKLHRHSMDSTARFSTDEEPALTIDALSIIDKPGSFASACDLSLASKKKNDEFHALFKSVPESDLLIDDYKCALQKDILLQGHLYLSEHHVCFKSNIFGWVTNLVIQFAEIERVEKRMTAKIIPNGILIATNTSTHIFASFLLRDQTYDQIIKIWNLSRHVLSQEKLVESDTDSLPSSTLDSAVVIQEEEEKRDAVQLKDSPIQQEKSSPKQTRPRSVSDSLTQSGYHLLAAPSIESILNSKRETQQPKPTFSKKARICPCSIRGQQYFHVALDQTYKGDVERMFKLLFDSQFMKSFLETYEQFEDVQIGSWKRNEREVTGRRRIKSSNTMGAKLVKVLFREQKVHKKYPYYCCVTVKKSMPDMPMGAVYSIQSRTCITRESKDKVHVLVTFQVVFSKTGLVSSIIEKNAAEDQLKLYRHLHYVLSQPDLIQQLVQDDPSLLDSLSHTPISPTPSSKLTRPTYLVYVGLFIVLLAHCILAIRMHYMSDHLQALYQQKMVAQDNSWAESKIKSTQQMLDESDQEIHDFDQRLSGLAQPIFM